MNVFDLPRTRRVQTDAERKMVLAVLQATYAEEKGWIETVDQLFPPTDLTNPDVSWFLAVKRHQPVGVLRVCYNPPVEQYLTYGLQPIDPTIDLTKLVCRERAAEIGRFAVVPERRRSIAVVLGLMRAAIREVVARDCAQLLTDVFENEQHSPLGFHTRILGFRPIATHDIGELRHKGRRIILLLDLKTAYRLLALRSNRLFRTITRSWTPHMHNRLAT